MPDWAFLPLLLLASWLLGWLVFHSRVLLQHREELFDLHPIEQFFVAIFLGLLLLGWLAFTLAEIGGFSLITLAAIWFVAVVVFGIMALRKRRVRALSGVVENQVDSLAERTVFAGVALPGWLEITVLLLWLPVALWLFFRPHESILGASDAGVYVNTAANIAKTGQILIEDETLAELDPALYPALLRERREGEGTPYYLYPGFNVVMEPRGRIIPDFFHLHPVWQAVAYAAGGVRAALRMPGLWALLGSLAIYLTLRQLSNWPVAMLALAGLSVNALQVWFARYPVSETLSQFLLWMVFWALGGWLGKRPPLRVRGLLAGLALGQLFLTRIDTLVLLAVPVLAALWLTYRRSWQRAHLWFFVPLVLLVLQGLAHAYFISAPYFMRISYYLGQLLTRYWIVVVGGGVGAFALLLLLFKFNRGDALRAFRRPLLALGVVLILLLTSYGWFIRPAVGATPSYKEWYDGQTIVVTDRENLVRLGWYLSPLGVWLGAAGAGLLLWRLNRRNVTMVVIGLLFSLVYLWRIQATPHQIYSMRRYVPATMPLFVCAAAYLLGWFGQQERRQFHLLALTLIPLWLGGLAWSARGFISQVDNQGLINQVQQLDARVADRSVFIFHDQSPVGMGDLLGTTLHYMYDHDAFTLRDPGVLEQGTLQQQIERWQQERREVYWVGDPGPLTVHGLAFEQDMLRINFLFLENAYDHKPTRLLTADWDLPLSRLK